jgi:hypothetical protein
MIEPSNNDYDLETITVTDPFEIGDTRPGRAAFRDWQVHWRDETTLMIAPQEHPDAWRPAHIYELGGLEGEFWSFLLEPPPEAKAETDETTEEDA